MKLVEVKTTDNLKIWLNPDQVSALEEVPSSARVEGHTKVYSGGFKFLVQEELAGLIKKLGFQTEK